MKAAISAFALFFAASAVLAADPPPQAVATIVAEGIGTTADEAVKDAFRNAIRQCVGAIVDAETLVKNDKIITDKVITYSNGFVKSYKELSKTEDKGVFRVRISAEVERRDLIKRLAEANVKVTHIDGKGLFAEVITDLEAAKSAKEVVEKLLTQFPHNCLQLQVVGKPEIVEKNERTVKLAVTVLVSIDRKKYAEGVKEFTTSLTKVSKPVGAFTLPFGLEAFNGDSIGTYKKENGPYQYFLAAPPHPFDKRSKLFEYVNKMMPGTYKDNAFQLKDKFIISVCTQAAKDYSSLVYSYYVLDSTCESCFQSHATQLPHANLILQGEEDNVIKRIEVPLQEFNPAATKGRDGGLAMDWFAQAEASLVVGVGGSGTVAAKNPDGRPYKERLGTVLISPTFIRRNANRLSHVPMFTVRVETTLNLDELKSLKSVAVELAK